MIQLDTTRLPHNDGQGIGAVQWVDRDTGRSSQVAHDGRYTRGGAYRYTQQRRSGGRPVTLSTSTAAGRPAAWLTTEQVEAVLALSETGAAYPLTIGDATMQVVFRHREAPAVELIETHPSSGKWAGVIKLETV